MRLHQNQIHQLFYCVVQNFFDNQKSFEQISRKVDEFDFDEDEFLAALEENQPIGSTGETAKGSVIAVEVLYLI